MNTKHEHEKQSTGSAAGTQRAPERETLMHKESAKSNRFVALVDLVRQNPNGDSEIHLTIKSESHKPNSVLPDRGAEYTISFEPYSAPR